MKKALLPALLILAVACSKRSQRVEEIPTASTPRVGLVVKMYEGLDLKSRVRVGFVEKTKYDRGDVIYWVTGPDHREKVGYVLPNNQAYKYVWEVGKRRAEPEFLGADVMTYQVRRILDYDKTVAMEPIDQEEVARQLAPNGYEKPKQEAPPAEEEEG
jgi:hypothetical protein